ncbi:glycosyltransferase involved in cell wall biosynthesis [Flavobacteriaceae bacterium MAR_2010_72]|nr:glycosyltransferase involved in cell wall biosynthesis [Flavobacteriaceae bacterium MAR_2010_72]
MKVLIVNTYDRGGAANACMRLHQGLLNQGIDSRVLLKEKLNAHIPYSYVCAPKQDKLSKFKTQLFSLFPVLKRLVSIGDPSKDTLFLERRAKALELFSFPYANYDITEHQLYKEADIVHLHWVAGFLDYRSFFKNNTKPVVWTLHDMNAFTGGEHYTETSLEIDAHGCPIPRQLTDAEQKLFARILKLKTQLFKTVDYLHIVAPSRWLAKAAHDSTVFKGRPIVHIPYGLDETVFMPQDPELARTRLNIPQGKTVVLFVADSITNARKGFVYLERALQGLQRDDVVICAIGHTHSAFSSVGQVIELGAIDDDQLMAMAYSAVDVFVIPSLMDNLPNTVLESLMCGTPVIGFPVGGITDMVQPGENGLLTEGIGVSYLLDTLQLFLNGEFKFDRVSIRQQAIKRYALGVQAKAYHELYLKILRNN